MKIILQPWFLRASAACVLAIGMAACGGGGGGTSTPATGNVLPTVSVSIPVATYATGSAEKGAYTALQSARVLCGFGSVQQNPQLDAASLAHAKYLTHVSVTTNTSLLSHYESVTSDPFFTGYAPWNRSNVAGYGTQVAEILAATMWPYDISNPPVFPNLEDRGKDAMLSLMNTVYHLIGAMYPGRDIGFGADIQTWSSGNSRREEFRLGSLNGYENPHQNIVLGTRNMATYPCQGSTDIPSSFAPADESPNPFPNLTLSSQKVGPPIYLKVDAGQVLVLTSYSVKQNNTTIPVTLIDYNYDLSVAGEVGQNEVFLVPSVALTPYTTYQVTVSGTINGTAFPGRSFSFSTGS
jgi:hypothetical protein